jgi:hypothetical protein
MRDQVLLSNVLVRFTAHNAAWCLIGCLIITWFGSRRQLRTSFRRTLLTMSISYGQTQFRIHVVERIRYAASGLKTIN